MAVFCIQDSTKDAECALVETSESITVPTTTHTEPVFTLLAVFDLDNRAEKPALIPAVEGTVSMETSSVSTNVDTAHSANAAEINTALFESSDYEFQVDPYHVSDSSVADCGSSEVPTLSRVPPEQTVAETDTDPGPVPVTAVDGPGLTGVCSSSPVSTETWKSRSGKRRERPCLYCSKYVKTLTRHLATVHKDQPDVKAARRLRGKMRNAAFNQLKRDGILKRNKEQMGLEQPVLDRERICKGQESQDVVFCGKCSGAFSRKSFYKHKKNCRTRESSLQPMAIPTSFIAVPRFVSEDFKVQILSRFIRDRVGVLCQTDETLVTVGLKSYFKLRAKLRAKKDMNLVRRNVMCEMRRLGSLFVLFEEECRQLNECRAVEVKDMVCRSSFPALEVAVHNYTDSESGMKASLKVSIYYLLKKLAKVVKSNHLVSQNDAAAMEVDRFVDVLTLNYDFLFGDSVHQANLNRQVKLGKPEQLPANINSSVHQASLAEIEVTQDGKDLEAVDENGPGPVRELQPLATSSCIIEVDSRETGDTLNNLVPPDHR